MMVTVVSSCDLFGWGAQFRQIRLPKPKPKTIHNKKHKKKATKGRALGGFSLLQLISYWLVPV